MSDAIPPVFGAGSRRILTAILEALTADDVTGELTAQPADYLANVVESFDDWNGHISPLIPLALGVVLRVLEILPPFLIGKFSRMSNLGLRNRVEFLDRVECSRFGMLSTAFIGLKVPLSMIAYEEGEALHLTGFDRPTIASRRKLPMLEITSSPRNA